MTKRDVIRRCRFTPYRPGAGPTFNLTLWDTHRTDGYGRSFLGYRLTKRFSGHGRGFTLFEAENFLASPLHSIDSDEAVMGLMSFLTVRLGDVDAEYFEDYTEIQRHFRDNHAEQLAVEIERRFGIEEQETANG